MDNLFNEGRNQGQSAPSMLMNEMSGTPSFDGYRYRVERFTLGGSDEDDEVSGLEALLTRSINSNRDVVIIERKDSISATTGIYTAIIIYMERIHSNQGEQHA